MVKDFFGGQAFTKMADVIIDGNKVKIIVSKDDIFRNTCLFKSYRDYIKHLFATKGFIVTKWRSGKDGIMFAASDSVLNMTIEITGIIGKNIRRIHASEKIDI